LPSFLRSAQPDSKRSILPSRVAAGLALGTKYSRDIYPAAVARVVCWLDLGNLRDRPKAGCETRTSPASGIFSLPFFHWAGLPSHPAGGLGGFCKVGRRNGTLKPEYLAIAQYRFVAGLDHRLHHLIFGFGDVVERASTSRINKTSSPLICLSFAVSSSSLLSSFALCHPGLAHAARDIIYDTGTSPWSDGAIPDR